LISLRENKQLELRHLRYFLAAAEEENFRRAAPKVGVSQAALSRQILDLEAHVGARLFIRERRRVRLSPAGITYLEKVKHIFREIENATETVRRVADGRGSTLRIGINHTACRCLAVPESFRQFRKAFPNMELRLIPMTSPDQMTALAAHEIDAGFVYDAVEPPPGLSRRRIAMDRMVLAVPSQHRLATRKTIHLADLKEEPFLWVPASATPPPYERLNSACHAGGLSPRIVYEFVNEEIRLNLVAASIGLSFVVSPIFANYPHVAFKKVSDLSVFLPLDLVWRQERRLPPGLSDFIGIVDALAKKSRTVPKNVSVRPHMSTRP
jgi:DNA-binding transcriptional LysR family regulator